MLEGIQELELDALDIAFHGEEALLYGIKEFDDLCNILITIHNKKEKFTTSIIRQYVNNITKNNLKRTANKFVKYGNFDLSNFLNNSKLHYKKNCHK